MLIKTNDTYKSTRLCDKLLNNNTLNEERNKSLKTQERETLASGYKIKARERNDGVYKWPTRCQVTQKGVRKADEVADRAAKRREEGNLRQYHKRKCTTGSSPLHSPPKPVERRSRWMKRLSTAQEDPQLESVEGRCSSETRRPRHEWDRQLRHDEK